MSAAQTPAPTSSDPTVRVPRAPVSRRDTSATGRADRPDPCADPPTVTIDPTRVMPAVPGLDLAGDPVAATVPRLRSVTPAGGGALGDGRVLAAASALGAAGSFAAWLLAARTLPPDRLGAAVAVVAVVAVAACVARPDRGAALVARLPAAGRRVGRVVVRSLATAVALGAAVGGALAVLVPGPAATLTALLPEPAGSAWGSPWPGVLLVAAATAAWAAGAVFDGVVVALDRPWWATAHIAVLVAGRIALIAAAGALLGAAVADTGGAGAGWLAAAWLAPVLLWALPGSAAVAVLARRHGRRVETAAPPQVLGPMAVARLGATLLHQVAPLAVVLGLGPGPGMVFFVAWQVVTAVDLAAVWVLGRAGGTSRRRLLLTRRAGDGGRRGVRGAPARGVRPGLRRRRGRAAGPAARRGVPAGRGARAGCARGRRAGLVVRPAAPLHHRADAARGQHRRGGRRDDRACPGCRPRPRAPSSCPSRRATRSSR